MVDDAGTVEDAINAVVLDHKRREVDRQSYNNKHQASTAYTIGWSVDPQVDPRKGYRGAEKLQDTEKRTKRIKRSECAGGISQATKYTCPPTTSMVRSEFRSLITLQI